MTPEVHQVTTGSDVTFKCSSNEEVRWEFNGSYLPSNTHTSNKKTSYSLTIYNVDYSNHGIYSCFGKDAKSEVDIYYVSKAELEIIGEICYFKYCLCALITSKH